MYAGTVASCIERAKDVHDGGMTYYNTSIKACGIATAVDSLLIIKKYIYEEKILTLDAFRKLMLTNWKNGDDLRLDILKETNRFGNGLVEPDTMAKHIFEHIAAMIVGRKNPCRGVYRLGADSVMHCMDHAVNIGATPDGRFAGMPFSRNMCSVAGMEREGVCGVIASTLCVDHALLLNGSVCDFLLHPSAVEGERGLDALVAMAKVYFERKGEVLQGNVFSLEDLQAAKKDHEKYVSLQVRLCGWNEFFVRMTPERQDEFIKRCQKFV